MTRHFEFFVEEESARYFVEGIMEKYFAESCTWKVYTFQGKHDMLRKLPERLRAFAQWIQPSTRLVILIDRDQDDCNELKQKLEDLVREANLVSKRDAGGAEWQAVTRIAIEELEAWYFGDWQAVCDAYPDLPKKIAKRKKYREPDSIKGGTWETLEKLMQKYGYYKSGLPKMEVARRVSKQYDPARSKSRSFRIFFDALRSVV